VQAHVSLLRLYAAALALVQGRRLVREALEARPLASSGPVHLLAVGKAAGSMAKGALESLGDDLIDGLVITKEGYAEPGLPVRIEQRVAGHPIPTAASLEAGERVVAYLQQMPEGEPLLFLLSGGASALMERLVPGVSLEQWRAANAWLLASGYPIEAVNAVRKRLSQLKAGGLLTWCGGREVRELVLSDVLGNDLGSIGSGPLHPGLGPLPQGVPDWLRVLLDESRPLARDRASLTTQLLADNTALLDAVEHAARREGLVVWRHAEPMQGEAELFGRGLAEGLLAAPAGLHLWGGECTVTLPDAPGVGGRCQALALAASEVLAGEEGITLLAGASDGSDGPGESAGAWVDGGSWRALLREGIDPHEALCRADAGTALGALGALIDTGPTGSNLNDLLLAWVDHSS